MKKTRFLSLLLVLCMLLPGAVAFAEERPTLTLFVDETWWQYDAWENAIPELFSERTGVNIEATVAADANQLALMIASGDMPDIVCTSNFTRMSDSNVSYALDELAAQYPEVGFNPHSVLQYVNAAADGHYYTINCHYSPDSVWAANSSSILHEGGGLVLNKTILEAVGNPEIKTIDDLEAAMKLVHETYPDLYTVVWSPIHKFNWLAFQYGLSPNGLTANSEGELEFYIRQEGRLDYYKRINKWYREGYIPADVFAFKTEAEEMELSVAGRTFADFGYDNFADVYNAKIKANGDEHVMIQFADIIGENAKCLNTSAGARGLYITKSCKDVEAAFRFVSYALSDEGSKLLMWGIEGEDYELNAEGLPVFNYDREDTDTMRQRGLKYWGWTSADAYVIGLGVTGETLNARKALTSITVSNPVIGMVRFSSDSDEAIIKSKLEAMIPTEEIKIFMAESEEACEAAYNEMIKIAEQIGMTEYEAAANAQYTKLIEGYNAIKNNEK